MRFILSLSVLFLAFNGFAQEDSSSPYTPYKAEYYIGKYNDGKDFSDMEDWAESFVRWAKNKKVYDNYGINLMTPYFHSDLTSIDVVWYGRYPNSTEQFAGLDYWINNGQSLLAKLPITNIRVVEVWQRDVSIPDNQSDSGNGYVMYLDCKLADGVTAQQEYDAYYKYALAAKEVGDNLGRKMMFPVTGMPTEWETTYDYMVVLYANSMTAYGVNNDLFWDKISGQLEEQKALADLGSQCFNRRSYSSKIIKR